MTALDVFFGFLVVLGLYQLLKPALRKTNRVRRPAQAPYCEHFGYLPGVHVVCPQCKSLPWLPSK